MYNLETLDQFVGLDLSLKRKTVDHKQSLRDYFHHRRLKIWNCPDYLRFQWSKDCSVAAAHHLPAVTDNQSRGKYRN